MTIQDIQAVYGQRSPAWDGVPQTWRLLTIATSNRVLSDSELALLDLVLSHYSSRNPSDSKTPPSVHAATQGRAILETRIADQAP